MKLSEIERIIILEKDIVKIISGGGIAMGKRNDLSSKVVIC